MWKKVRSGIALPAILTIIGLASYSCQNQGQTEKIPKNELIRDTVRAQVESFYDFVKDDLRPAVADDGSSSKDLQKAFLKARLLYKRFQWAGEYFMGDNSILVNGPPDPEVENADLLDPALTYALDPNGLQVIEEMLFPEYDEEKKGKLLEEIDRLIDNTDTYRDFFRDNSISDWRILDGAKLEVFRIITLGITGFDNELTLNSMEESAASLKSLKNVLAPYAREKDRSGLIRQIDSAIIYLDESKDFDAFDRAKFITDYANEITPEITKLQHEYDGFEVRYNRLLRQDAKTLFDSGAFNVDAFTPGPDYHMTDERVDLGERLFNDPSLSGTGTRSCATCHKADKGFTDGLRKNTNIHTGQALPRNTPTLLNAALQSNLFWDMRVLTLEDQARDVIQNEDEMDGSLKDIVKYVSQDSTYKKLFTKAYPETKEKSIDSMDVVNALASYERSLTKLNSRFDQYMRGDSTALNEDEVKGFNLYMGKAKCATCHFMPLFNGVRPPEYVESEAEKIGVPVAKTDTVLDPDIGWYEFSGIPYYKHAFKTPTVRNVSKKEFYMHNGAYESLEDLMEFYNNAGGPGMGIEVEDATLPEDSLELSDKEIDQINAFMESLDSRY